MRTGAAVALGAATATRSASQIGAEASPRRMQPAYAEVGSMSGRSPRPPASERENEKAPQMPGFITCAEEDSNLHPVIPDQALNLARLPIPPSARGLAEYSPGRPGDRLLGELEHVPTPSLEPGGPRRRRASAGAARAGAPSRVARAGLPCRDVMHGSCRALDSVRCRIYLVEHMFARPEGATAAWRSART